MKFKVDYANVTNPIVMEDKTVEFVDNTEHVEILRSTKGNHTTIQARITAHRKAFNAVLHVRLARIHSGYRCVSIRVH